MPADHGSAVGNDNADVVMHGDGTSSSSGDTSSPRAGAARDPVTGGANRLPPLRPIDFDTIDEDDPRLPLMIDGYFVCEYPGEHVGNFGFEPARRPDPDPDMYPRVYTGIAGYEPSGESYPCGATEINEELANPLSGRCSNCANGRDGGRSCYQQEAGKPCDHCREKGRPCDVDLRVPTYTGPYAEERALVYRDQRRRWEENEYISCRPAPNIRLAHVSDLDVSGLVWVRISAAVEAAKAHDVQRRGNYERGVGSRQEPGEAHGVLPSLRSVRREVEAALPAMRRVFKAVNRALVEANVAKANDARALMREYKLLSRQIARLDGDDGKEPTLIQQLDTLIEERWAADQSGPSVPRPPLLAVACFAMG
ncbi:uncharacterized protein PFL1_04856 [Pseudozyma flocculosa PF-1]|uniref:Uncharacterized protein n=1 Tax=Pseudozyma flocculosa PF-1 TaxID=1277687 RepID=A0A061H4Z5_9BASI|nr:uncharacterized protein PFL1_04856 [Pseudozyma flocculosa PF-1]EPQ27718.1 hypothetical protein PFL1_04856 [Pseudozyma flocculosa PF-1]